MSKFNQRSVEHKVFHKIKTKLKKYHWSISPTRLQAAFTPQIPKVQKDSQVISVFSLLGS
jgi:hypothetical protein